MIKSEKLSLVSLFGRDSFFACQQGLKDVGSVCVATEPIEKSILIFFYYLEMPLVQYQSLLQFLAFLSTEDYVLQRQTLSWTEDGEEHECVFC